MIKKKDSEVRNDLKDANCKVKACAFTMPPLLEITSTADQYVSIITDQFVSLKPVPSIAEGKEN